MNAKELAYELLHYPFSEESATELIKAYGKREIEKDRERVKAYAKVKAVIHGNELDVASYKTSDGLKFSVSKESIDQTPINLD